MLGFKIERLVLFLLSKETIESMFKLLSYLGGSAIVIGLAKYALAQRDLLEAILFILLFLLLLTQSIFYALQTIVLPAVNVIPPERNAKEIIANLQSNDVAERRRALKGLLLSKPGVFLLLAFIGLFYAMNGILGSLVEGMAVVK